MIILTTKYEERTNPKEDLSNLQCVMKRKSVQLKQGFGTVLQAGITDIATSQSKHVCWSKTPTQDLAIKGHWT